jgi:hypothetical protein
MASKIACFSMHSLCISATLLASSSICSLARSRASFRLSTLSLGLLFFDIFLLPWFEVAGGALEDGAESFNVFKAIDECSSSASW